MRRKTACDFFITVCDGLLDARARVRKYVRILYVREERIDGAKTAAVNGALMLDVRGSLTIIDSTGTATTAPSISTRGFFVLRGCSRRKAVLLFRLTVF
ncbi:MAG: hypothetical protein IJU52_07880 [Clostridia bacterium]|nr:hypothetical protein [Clostridia bacterium]